MMPVYSIRQFEVVMVDFIVKLHISTFETCHRLRTDETHRFWIWYWESKDTLCLFKHCCCFFKTSRPERINTMKKIYENLKLFPFWPKVFSPVASLRCPICCRQRNNLHYCRWISSNRGSATEVESIYLCLIALLQYLFKYSVHWNGLLGSYPDLCPVYNLCISLFHY